MSKKLGEILVEDGKLTEAQLQRSLKAQLIFGGHLGTSLIELGYIDEDTLGETLARAFNVPYASVDILQGVPYSVVRSIPAKLVEKYKVVPIRLDGKVLQLAMMDPKNLMALDEISFVTGYKIDPWVSPEIRIFQVLEKYYNIARSQRYITLARELGKLKSRHDKIQPGAASDRGGSQEAGAESETLAADSADNVETGPMHAVTAPPPSASADSRRDPAAPRPAPDPWEKYGYGRSWREYAEEMERGAPPPPRSVATERPAPKRIPGVGVSPELELAEASKRLAACSTPEEVAEVVLTFAARFLKRSALFILRGDQAVGWGGAGEGFDTVRIRGLTMPLVRDSLLSLIDDSGGHFLGAVPAFPSIRRFYQDLSVPMPRAALLVPIRIKEKLASVLYGDGGTEDDLRAIDVDSFERLSAKAALALQMIIFRNKILS